MARLSYKKIQYSPNLNLERLGEDIGNLLVLAPHPDDESLGCGGLINLLTKLNKKVGIIFLTSGSASHPNSATHPPSKLSKIRELEALKACNILGVAETDRHFLYHEDGKLKDLTRRHINEISHEIANIFTQGNFNAIATPWRRDPHPDHIAAYNIGEAVCRILNNKPLRIEYPIWLWKNGITTDWPYESEVSCYKLDISTVFDEKWKAIAMHQSQLGQIIRDDIYGFVLTDELLEPFKTNTEYFFLTKQQNLRTLSSEYFNNLYSVNIDPWNFRESEYEQEKYNHSIQTLKPHTYDYCLELGCSIGVQSEMLSDICRKVLAVDISEKAIVEAKKNYGHKANIEFRVKDVTENFPIGTYDLIICSEMAYYLKSKDLMKLFDNVNKSLRLHGKFLMVHWTGFVPNYPLSGNEVHDVFSKNAIDWGFQELVHQKHQKYRLQLWDKVRADLSK